MPTLPAGLGSASFFLPRLRRCPVTWNPATVAPPPPRVPSRRAGRARWPQRLPLCQRACGCRVALRSTHGSPRPTATALLRVGPSPRSGCRGPACRGVLTGHPPRGKENRVALGLSQRAPTGRHTGAPAFPGAAPHPTPSPLQLERRAHPRRHPRKAAAQPRPAAPPAGQAGCRRRRRRRRRGALRPLRRSGGGEALGPGGGWAARSRSRGRGRSRSGAGGAAAAAAASRLLPPAAGPARRGSAPRLPRGARHEEDQGQCHRHPDRRLDPGHFLLLMAGQQTPLGGRRQRRRR